jgi:hypothetical protein
MQALNQGKSVESFCAPRIGYFFRLGFGVASRLALEAEEQGGGRFWWQWTWAEAA